MVAGLGAMWEAVRGRVDMRIVYVAEAHATDEWPIGTMPQYSAAQHESLQARHAAAEQMVRALPALRFGDSTILLDGMDDMMVATYGVWPTRLLCFRRNASGPCLAFQSVPEDCRFDMFAFWERVSRLV